MKVILKVDIKGLGKKEEMVEAKDGYARNYLLPRGMAVPATAENLGIMTSKKKAETEKVTRETEHARNIASKLSGKTIVIEATAGENGKLFGSITNKDVSDALKQQMNLDVDKKKIIMNDNIKTTGQHKVTAKLYTGVDAEFTVSVKVKD